MKPKIGVVIQARMSSSRLPGKSLMLIKGKPLVWHVIERLKKSKTLNAIVLATSIDASDDALEEFASKENINFFRGNLDDVLDRYYQAVKEYKLDIIVRVTGDCPIVDPEIIDNIVNRLIKNGYDYASNCKEPWADGFDVEVFTFSALEDAWKNAKLQSEREHVTPYIKKNAKKSYYMDNDFRLGNLHFSVDRENDLKLITEIYNYFYKEGKDHEFTQKDVLELLEKKPELKDINKDSVINEGYIKSIKEDKKVK